MSEVIRNSKGEPVGRLVDVPTDVSFEEVLEIQKSCRVAEAECKRLLTDHRQIFKMKRSPAELLGMAKAFGAVADALSDALYRKPIRPVAKIIED